MARPNSRATAIRRWLAAQLDPMPSPGEAWCLDCALNDGRTALLPADGMAKHCQRHLDENPGGYVTYRASWPNHERG